VPVSEVDRVPGSTPYYGANGIQGYVQGCTHKGEFILVAEDGANDLKNYPVQYVNGEVWVNNHAHVLQGKLDLADTRYLGYTISQTNIEPFLVGGGRAKLNASIMMKIMVPSPQNTQEQQRIGLLFDSIDSLITLHQRKPPIKENKSMQTKRKELLCNYFEKWIKVYKEGAVRKVTLKKYYLSLHWIKTLVPKLKLFQIDRLKYQQILNCYAENHEKQTVMDFHHHLKSTILDAVDDGMIDRDPTRKVIIKGMVPKAKKPKYLNQYELHVLLTNLDLTKGINNDWLILLIAKTGMRFSEAVALTPTDFDFAHQILSVSKTWNYKEGGGFQPTKNKSSIRKIPIDWMIVSQFSELIKNLPSDSPIFVNGKIYNSTVNDVLTRHCKKNGIPCITIHGLRHTHASLLLFAGVSIASVAKRLGHSSMNTTEKTYLHIIQELENKDVDLVMRSVSGLC